ncbi:MAG: peptidase M3 [Myxococcaceae bacterium]|nr:peptidase M3 [Myxococcaceae bacterium]
MELSVKSLRSRVEPFLSELGALEYRQGAGLSAAPGIGALMQSWPELTRAETFAQVREAMSRSSLEADEKKRLRALLELVATLVEDRLAVEAIDEIATFEANATIRLSESAVLPFHEAVAGLPLEPSRPRRDLIEQGLAHALAENARPYARRREAALRAAEVLGAGSYEALRTEVTGIDAGALVPACEAFLRQTEDAYRDVFAYALKKLDPHLRPLPSGDARRHDLQRIAAAPWLAEHFRREELLPAIHRCIEELGFHPSANGRIQLDTEDRPGKRPRPFVAEVKVPDDIRLVVKTGYGLDDFYALLHEYGHALHFAHTSRSAPVEERRLGDRSVAEAWAFLFNHFLIDERWHKRFLRLPQAPAREAARIAAFNELATVRRHCARLLYERSLYQSGPSKDRAEEYEQRQADALFIAANRSFFLWDVDPHLYVVRYLRAWALEAEAHRALQERFDEDYWRNPSAGRWLMALFERGLRDDADALAAELGGGPLALERVGERLVSVLNR